MTAALMDVRLRSRISEEELSSKAGKVLTPADWNLQLTGPALVRKPDGRPLCVYLPGAMREQSTPEVYDLLHALRTGKTDNRGEAGGTQRLRRGEQNRTRTAPIASSIIGAMDPAGVHRYCRLTAWTGKHLPEWERLQPYLQTIAAALAEHVPDRYAAQVAAAAATEPAWVVPGTPFTTVTVNNTYPTGVHTDSGDLDAGYSSIAVIRRGPYSGGQLCFPRYRVAVDLQDTDLLLMDAHEHHGNAALICQCGDRLRQLCPTCKAERISTVAYYRTQMQECGPPDAEAAKAAALRERTTHGATAPV